MQSTTKEVVNAVINTPELLENILSHLDTKSLLLSQRVSKQFQGTISGSSVLQQALFFKLASKDGTRFGTDGVNDLFMDVKRERAIDILPQPIGTDTSTVNPKMQIHCLSVPRTRGRGRPRRYPEDEDKEREDRKYEILLNLRDVRDFRSGTESWRRMYVLQRASKKRLMESWRSVVYQGSIGGSFTREHTPFLTAGEMFEVAWGVADDGGFFDWASDDEGVSMSSW